MPPDLFGPSPFSMLATPGRYTVPTEMEEEDWLTKLNRTVLAPLQYIGETLDKPGRAMRGLLAGRPDELLNLIPFSDTVGLTDPTKSVSGRDLLRQWDMADKEDTWGNFLGGLGVEIVTDPTNLLTFGANTALGKTLSQAGKGMGWARYADIRASDLAKLPEAVRPIIETGGSGATDLARATLGGAGRLHAGKANIIPEAVEDAYRAATGQAPKALSKVTEFTQPLDAFGRNIDEPLQIWERLPARRPADIDEATRLLQRGEMVQPGTYRRMVGDLPDELNPATLFVEPTGRGALLEGGQKADELYKTVGIESPFFLPKLWDTVGFNLEDIPGAAALGRGAKSLAGAVVNPLIKAADRFLPAPFMDALRAVPSSVSQTAQALFNPDVLGFRGATMQDSLQEFGTPAKQRYEQATDPLLREAGERLEPEMRANPGRETDILKATREAVETGRIPSGAGLEPPFSPKGSLPEPPPPDAPESAKLAFEEQLRKYRAAQKRTAEQNPLLSPKNLAAETSDELPQTQDFVAQFVQPKQPLELADVPTAPPVAAYAERLGMREEKVLPAVPGVPVTEAVPPVPAKPFVRPTPESLLERIGPRTKYGRHSEVGGESTMGAIGARQRLDAAGNVVETRPQDVAKGEYEKGLHLSPAQLADENFAERVLKNEREVEAALRSWEKMREPGVLDQIAKMAKEAEGLYAGYDRPDLVKESLDRMLKGKFGPDFRLVAQEPAAHLWPVKDRGGMLEALYRHATDELGEAKGPETLQRIVDTVKGQRLAQYDEAAQRIAQAGGPALTGQQLMDMDRAWTGKPRTGETVGKAARKSMSKEEKAQEKLVAELEKSRFYEGLGVPGDASGKLSAAQKAVDDELRALRKQKPDTEKIIDAYEKEFTKKVPAEEALKTPALRDTGFDPEDVVQYASIPPEDLLAVLKDAGVKNPENVAQALAKVELPRASTLDEAAEKFPGDALPATERQLADDAYKRFIDDMSARPGDPGSIVPPPDGSPPPSGVPGGARSPGAGPTGGAEDPLRRVNQISLRAMEDVGLNRELADLLNDFGARASAFENEAKLSEAGRKVSRNINSAIEREDLLKGLPRGTRSFDDWVKDARLSGAKRTLSDANAEAFILKELHDGWAKFQRVTGEAAPTEQALKEQAKQLSSRLKELPEEYVKNKLDFFRTDPIADTQRYARKVADLVSVGEASLAGAARKAVARDAMTGDPARYVSLEQFLSDSGRTFNRLDEQGNIIGGARHKLAQMLGTVPENLENYVIPRELAKELSARVTPFVAPEAMAPLLKAYDQYTSTFKTWVTLLRPAFYVRNLMDFAWRAWRDDIPVTTGVKAGSVMGKIVRGKADDAGKEFARELVRQRIALNPHVTNNAEFVAASHVTPANLEKFAPKEVQKLQDIVSGMGADGQRARPKWSDIKSQIQKEFPDRSKEALEAAKSWQSRQYRQTPLGMTDERYFTETGPMARVKQFNQDLEDWMRGTHYIAKRMMGFSEEAAAQSVMKYHFDYSKLTDFERNVMKRIFPFYTFSSRSAPSILHDLATKPGKVATTARVANTGREEGFVPSWLGGQAIPVPGAPAGQQRFLSSLGLPLDDVAFNTAGRLLSGQPLEALREVMGATNPFLKTPVELATGRNLLTDRNLADTKPSPLLSSLTPEQAGVAQTFLSATPFTGPANQLNNLLRTFDRGVGATALQTLTGLKLTDVDRAKAREMEAQKLIKDLFTGSGRARQFANVYVPQDQRSQLTPQENELLGLLDVLNKRRQIAALERRAQEGDAEAREKLARMRGSDVWSAAFR